MSNIPACDLCHYSLGGELPRILEWGKKGESLPSFIGAQWKRVAHQNCDLASRGKPLRPALFTPPHLKSKLPIVETPTPPVRSANQPKTPVAGRKLGPCVIGTIKAGTKNDELYQIIKDEKEHKFDALPKDALKTAMWIMKDEVSKGQYTVTILKNKTAVKLVHTKKEGK